MDYSVAKDRDANRETVTDTSPPPSPGQPRRRIWRVLAKTLVPLLILAAGAGAYAALKATRPEVPQRPKAEKVWPVAAVPVSLKSERPVISLYGDIRASRKVALRALVAGKVLRISPNLREGGTVAAGEALLTIDPFVYEGAVAEAEARLAEARARLKEIDARIALEVDALAQAQEQLRLAEKDYARAQTLVKRGSASQKLADDRRLLVSQRRQAVTQRRHNIAIQKTRKQQQEATIRRLTWSLTQAKRQLADTVLRAPFAAYVTQANVEVGRLVNVNDLVATLIDQTEREVRFVLPETDYGRLQAQGEPLIGRKVTIQWQAGQTRFTYDGIIDRLGAEIDPNSGGIAVFARLLPASPHPLPRPGTFVEVRLPDRRYDQVARLPPEALHGGDHVFVIHNGRLDKRPVRIIGQSGQDFLVRGKLSNGERVLVTRLTAAAQGLRVKELAQP